MSLNKTSCVASAGSASTGGFTCWLQALSDNSKRGICVICRAASDPICGWGERSIPPPASERPSPPRDPDSESHTRPQSPPPLRKRGRRPDFGHYREQPPSRPSLSSHIQRQLPPRSRNKRRRRWRKLRPPHASCDVPGFGIPRGPTG